MPTVPAVPAVSAVLLVLLGPALAPLFVLAPSVTGWLDDGFSRRGAPTA